MDNRKNCEQILKFLTELMSFLKIDNYVTYFYGSSTNTVMQYRDIDIVIISKDIKYVENHVNEKLKCSVYIVPEKIFKEDVLYMSFGGFYANKFIFSFSKVQSKGIYLNAPNFYWESFFNKFLMEKNGIFEVSVKEFIHEVHETAYKYNPLIRRSLLKYQNNEMQISALEIFVEDLIRDNSADYTNISWKENKENNYEKIFYLFWKEYNKFKSPGELWGEKTFIKIEKSCSK